jgi:hypothetical protein
MPGAPVASFANCREALRWRLGRDDRCGHSSLSSPLLQVVMITYAFPPGGCHLCTSLVTAESSGVAFAFFLLLSRFFGGKELDATRASLEHRIGRIEKLSVPNLFSLLSGGKTLAPSPKLGLNFPKRTLRPAFRTL